MRTLALLVLAVAASACHAGCAKKTAAGDGNLPEGATNVEAPDTNSAVNDDGKPVATDDASINGVVPPERRTTWKPGVTYNGGIPSRTTVCKTLSPSGGDDTQALTDAINNCPDNQVVQLTAGTFKVTGDGIGWRKSKVTLRGAAGWSPGQPGGSRIIKADAASNANSAVFYVGGTNPQQFVASLDLAKDAVKGSDHVELKSNPGIAVGEFVLIDHVTNEDPIVFWGQNHEKPGEGSRRWFDRQDRSLSQILEVKAVTGNKITFHTPLHWTFKTQFKAQLARYGEDGQLGKWATGAGIENIYVGGGRGGDYHGNIAMGGCAYCFIKGVESDNSVGTAIGFYGTYRCELRDSYIHSAADPNPGGGGYLTGMNYGASDNLFENNIVWNGNKMIVMRATGGGNVVAYNYMEDGFGDNYKDIQEVGLNAGHYTTPHMELFEGNQSFNIDGDSGWGNSVAITYYRNHLTALRRDVGKKGLVDFQNRRAIALNRWHYNYNFIGNVLGTKGQKLLPGQSRFVYEVTGGFPQDDNDRIVTMWQFGYNGEDVGQPFDPKVAQTAVRHGNFDFVSNRTVYDANLPKALPPSLYTAKKPDFFGNDAWPWVTPEDAANPVKVLPARARFDAMPSH